MEHLAIMQEFEGRLQSEQEDMQARAAEADTLREAEAASLRFARRRLEEHAAELDRREVSHSSKIKFSDPCFGTGARLSAW